MLAFEYIYIYIALPITYTNAHLQRDLKKRKKMSYENTAFINWCLSLIMHLSENAHAQYFLAQFSSSFELNVQFTCSRCCVESYELHIFIEFIHIAKKITTTKKYHRR